jgi:apolipoprotein D and lipocalin family protein
MNTHYISWTVPSLFMLCLIFSGCFIPKELRTESIPTVKNFDLQRYLGVWYEIARLPQSFENGLEQVTATYTLQDDGTIQVLNKGFDTSKGKWKEAIGKAYIPDTAAGALLKVSFFWIFYAEYKVIVLDSVNYSYAMVTSSSKKYLWILSRSPRVDQSVYDELIRKANEWGFKVSDLYRVHQL